MNKNKLVTNYQKVLDKHINQIIASEKVPKLLIHSCCAPCSSYVLEYLTKYFEIMILYYNPNIFPREEYQYRIEEQRRLIEQLPAVNAIQMQADEYTPEEFHQISNGLEHEPEGGERCSRCYELRLRRTGLLANEMKMDYFTTTLSVSPLKNADKLNKIGDNISREVDVAYLFSDFKKRGGYQRSMELSKKYELYRQNYCGCIYSSRNKVTT